MAPEGLGLLDRVRRDVERSAAMARNAVRLATASSHRGGATPHEMVWQSGRAQLWHYPTDRVALAPPLVIVFSLVSRSYILDLAPGNSFIDQLLEAGFDVFMLDWGVPDERDAGNTLEDYVDEFIPAAINRVCALTGSPDVNLLGYCLGGDLTLMYLAHHADAPVRSLTTMATPVDFTKMGQLTRLLSLPGADALDEHGNVPAEAVHRAFQSISPPAEATRYVDLWERLWNDDYVTAYQAMTGWGDDHVPMAGAVATQIRQMLARRNALMTDRLVLGGDQVHLSDIHTPYLAVLAERDTIIPKAAAEPAAGLVGSAQVDELRLDAGHVGLVVGKTAARTTIPRIIEFLRSRSESAPGDPLTGATR